MERELYGDSLGGLVARTWRRKVGKAMHPGRVPSRSDSLIENHYTFEYMIITIFFS